LSNAVSVSEHRLSGGQIMGGERRTLIIRTPEFLIVRESLW
jgi:hypothetical protein